MSQVAGDRQPRRCIPQVTANFRLRTLVERPVTFAGLRSDAAWMLRRAGEGHSYWWYGCPSRVRRSAAGRARTPVKVAGRSTSLHNVLAARVRLTLIAVTLCALAAVAGVLLALQSMPDTTGLHITNGWAGAQRPRHQPVPDFALANQDGKTVTSEQLKGHPVVF